MTGVARATLLLAIVLIAAGCGGGLATPTPVISPHAVESTSPRASETAIPTASEGIPSGEAGTPLEVDGRAATVVTAWRGGFAALGEDLVWTSADGMQWTAADTTGIDGVVVDVIERGDGLLLAFGYRETRDTDAFRTWASDDGVSWNPVEALPGEFVFLDVAHGDRGYLLAGRRLLDTGGPNPEQLWYSEDALSWEVVRDSRSDQMIAAVGAGPEGFVAVGQQGWQSGEPRALVVASGDGKTWLEAPADDPVSAARGLFTVAALGGDWLSVPLTTGGELPILWSADGLVWEVRSTLEVEPVDVGVLGHLYSDGSRVFLSIVDGGGRTVTSDELLLSTDAVSWSPTRIPRPSMSNAFAMNGAVLVFLVDGIAYVDPA